MYKKYLSAVVFAVALVFGNSTSAAVVDWGFNSGATNSASVTVGAFTATITADGTQSFSYPTSYLRSAASVSSNTITLSFNEAIYDLSFDIGSLDVATHEGVLFEITPTLTTLSNLDVDWTIGGPASLDGMSVTHNNNNDSSSRVSFTGLGGITSFTFTETSTDNSYAIYYDNFSATVVPIPPTVWLFGSGLIGLIGAARRKAGT